MAVWEKTIDFERTPNYGSKYLLYLGVQPQASNASFRPGNIHGGYGNGLAAMKGSNGSGDFVSSAGVMHRDVEAEDVRVRLTARKALALGTGTKDEAHMRPLVGVMARIQGGTLTDDGTVDVRFADPDCYLATVERQGDGTVRFKLSRYLSGTGSVLLQSEPFTPQDEAFYTDFDIELKLTTNGSDVDFVLTVSGLEPPPGQSAVVAAPKFGGQFGGGPTFIENRIKFKIPIPKRPPMAGPDPLDTIVLEGTDSSASAILGAGRAGFIMDRERIESDGTETVMLASSFLIEDDPDGTPTTLWLDDFIRTSLNSSLLLAADVHGIAGRSMQSEFSNDQFGIEQTNQLNRGTGDFVTMDETEDMGAAADLSGVGTPAPQLFLNLPQAIYPNPPIASAAAWTFVLWANLTANRDGNGLVDHYDTGAEDGFAFGLVTSPDIGGLAAAKFEITLGNGTAATVYNSDPFVVEGKYLGESFAYAVTYKANTDPSNGAGRLRCYIGRFGQALLIDEIAVASSVRPTLQPTFSTILGERKDKTGAAADRALQGTIDLFAVAHSAEVQLAGIDKLMATYFEETDPVAQLVADLDVSLDALWPMDVWTGSPLVTAPILGLASATLEMANGATEATSGLPTSIPSSKSVAFHHRPSFLSSADQRVSVKFKLGGPLSRGRAIVRGAYSNAVGVYFGYALDVAAGSPAFIQLVRVGLTSATTSTREVIARQSLVSGSISISTGAQVKIDLEASQGGLGPLADPTIHAEIDGVAVTWEVVSPHVLLDLNGDIRDPGGVLPGTAKLVSGGSVGFEVITVGSTAVEIDDFVIETPSLTAPDPATFPAYAIPAEDDGKTGSLESVLVPGWSIERRRNHPRKEDQFYDGTGVRMLLGTFARRFFEARLVGATSAEVVDLLAFFDSHKGRQIPFDFDPSAFLPAEISGVFNFTEPRLRVGWSNNARVYAFGLEEKVQS